MLKSERVNRMINEFMKYHNEGYSIPEIAEIFHLDFSTVYRHLQTIADNNNVTRESLLQVIQKSHANVSGRKNNNGDYIDPTELLNDYDELLALTDRTISKIEKILNKQ